MSECRFCAKDDCFCPPELRNVSPEEYAATHPSVQDDGACSTCDGWGAIYGSYDQSQAEPCPDCSGAFDV